MVQWNNHGNDIKKDWTEDFIDDFPDKEEDDDYDGDDKSHESCQRIFSQLTNIMPIYFKQLIT